MFQFEIFVDIDPVDIQRAVADLDEVTRQTADTVYKDSESGFRGGGPVDEETFQCRFF